MPKRQSEFEKLVEAGVIHRGDDEILRVEWIPTGTPQLDDLLGGGIPKARIVEIYGGWSAGKSLITQMVVAEFQRLGLLCAVVDTEQSFDPEWWTLMGVDTGELLVSQPGVGEACVDVVQALVGNVDLLVVDSLAGMVPTADYEESAEQMTMGQHPRLVGRMFKKIVPELAKANADPRRKSTSVIVVNQTRASFTPGVPDSLPGGRAQEYFSHIMLRLRRRGWIEVAGERTGFNMEVRNTKNKLGVPWKEVILPVGMDGQFDFITVLMSDAVDRDVILRSGPWYRIPAALVPEGDHPEDLKQTEDGDWYQVMGRGALREVLMADKELRDNVEEETYRTATLAG